MATPRQTVAAPSGTVTFLFSDIEGSTSRWENAPAAMKLALERHDRIVRDAVDAHDGFIFKTAGDSFCVAFGTVRDAVACAVAAQEGLQSEDFDAVDRLRVRMALHTGTADERDGDYFGPTVNRVARLLAAAHGGQVLISAACCELLQDSMPATCSLVDLGVHRLKDLANPEHVYQLAASGLEAAFPVLPSLDHVSNNLPPQLTSFVGREETIAGIKSSLSQHRLITLVGTGGAGKTRCALQAGGELLDEFPDGVWYVELAPISDSSLVASSVARALSLKESANRLILETLLAYLKRKRLLLVLDNCEHVIEDARRVAAQIIYGCPDVRILATSRESLNLTGEQVYRIPSLSLPPPDKPITAQNLGAFGASLLFEERALSADSRFQITDQSAPYIAEICRRLDGIPLAIELAAARIKVLSPRQLAQKLDERFRVLTGGDRSALPRHQTMRALIDWSYDLLPETERALFRKLSLFAGGFSLESAAAVSSAGDELEAMELLASLIDKSLVQAEPADGGTRYRLLESTRQYARERLTEAGEFDATADAHAAAFLALAEHLDQNFDTMPDRVWWSQAELELENFRAALEWALGARGDVPLGQVLAGTLRTVWGYFGRQEGLRWIQMAQDLVDAETPPATMALLDFTESHLASAQMQYVSAVPPAERALARYRDLGDQVQIARTQWNLGRLYARVGRLDEAGSLLTQALSEARRLNAQKIVVAALGSLGSLKAAAGDSTEGLRLADEALTLARACGHERYIAVIAQNRAEQQFRAGDAAAALALAEEALVADLAFNDRFDAAITQCNIAAYLVALGRCNDARRVAREALAVARDAQWEAGIIFALQHMAAAAVLDPASAATIPLHRSAARIVGYIDSRLAGLQASRENTERQEYERVLAVMGESLGESEVSKLMAEGGAWSEDGAVAEAMQL